MDMSWKDILESIQLAARSVGAEVAVGGAFALKAELGKSEAGHSH